MAFVDTTCVNTSTSAKCQTVAESLRMLVTGTAITIYDMAPCSDVRSATKHIHRQARLEIINTCIVIHSTNACNAIVPSFF